MADVFISYHEDSAGEHTVGLRHDGTVVAVGGNDKGQCNVSRWRDIVEISAGNGYTMGLKRDGTVIATGGYPADRINAAHWTDIRLPD